MSIQNRVAAGVPSGGRFAGTEHPESGITLTKSSSTDASVGPDPWDLAALNGRGEAWRGLDFDPTEAEQWSSFGFSPQGAGQWRDAGLESGESTWWQGRGFVPATAGIWKAVNATPQVAQSFRDGQYAPKTAAPWIEHGFDCQAAEEWQSNGVTRAAAADGWKTDGFTPREARGYAEVGIPRSQARKWRSSGFTGEQAADWDHLGIKYAQEWAPTHTPQDAEGWLRADTVSSPEEALAWEHLDVTPDEAVRWKVVGLVTPADVQPWHEAGFDSSEVWMWRAQQFTAEQATRYRDQHLSPRAAFDVHHGLRSVA